jgi:hypothetical protein
MGVGSWGGERERDGVRGEVEEEEEEGGVDGRWRDE